MVKAKKLAKTIIEDISEPKQEDGRAKASRVRKEAEDRREAKNISETAFIGEVLSPATTTETSVQYVDSNTREITIKFQVKTNVIKAEDVIDEVQNVLLVAAPEIAAKLKEVIVIQENLYAATRQK